MAKLWLRNEVFHGVLPMQLDLTPSRARELVAALRLASPLTVDYTQFVTESWRLLGWNEPHAKLFWEMVCLFRNASLPTTQVPLSVLAIFLLIHVPHFVTSPRINPAPVAAFTEVWPAADGGVAGAEGGGESRSPRSPRGSPRGSPSRHSTGSEGPGGMARGGETSPRSPSSARALCLAAAASAEGRRLGFVRDRVYALLQLVSSDPLAAGTAAGTASGWGQEGPSTDHHALGLKVSAAELEPGQRKAPFRVSADDVDRLGFLIAGGPDLSTPVARLSSLAPCFDKETGSASADAVAAWLTEALTVNEMLYPPPPSPASSEDRAAHGDAAAESLVVEAPKVSVEPQTPRPASTLGSAHLPRVINLVSRRTVLVRSSSEAHDGALRDVHVNHCSDAHIYLLEPYRCATIFGCTDCTIVVGAVQGLLRVLGCERVQVVGACRRLLVSSCADSVFPCFAATHPLLAGDNRACQFAPYNTAYPDMAAHLARASLPTASPPAVNYWNAPLDVNTMVLPGATPPVALAAGAAATATSEGYGADAAGLQECESATTPFSLLLPPQNFYTFVVPHRGEAAQRNPFALPLEYAAALGQRLEAVKAAQELVTAAALPAGARAEVEAAVRAHFAEWLVGSGNVRQVLDLVQLDHEHVARTTHEPPPAPLLTAAPGGE